jgi:hypothetical protein
MAPIDRPEDNDLLTAPCHPLRHRILREPADVEERQRSGPGSGRGSDDGGTGGEFRRRLYLRMGGAMKTIDDNKTTWAEDEGVESAVLRQLLDLHPVRLTLEELTREFGASRNSFAERDAVERAVRDLAAAGLLHQGEEFVAPTRAALRFSELLDR